MLFPFEDAPNTATLICCHILDQNASILYVFMMKMMECGNFYVINNIAVKRQG